VSQSIAEQDPVATLYLKRQEKGHAVLNIPGTAYELHLVADEPLTPTPQGRVRGVVRLPVWKADVVTAGGAFIEPVFGRPRRVQGTVVQVLPASNSVVVDVCGQPIVGDLPARWDAAQFVIGTRVGLDLPKGGTFEPAQGKPRLASAASQPPMVNLRV
jgi:hypothetical protein